MTLKELQLEKKKILLEKHKLESRLRVINNEIAMMKMVGEE